MFNVKFVMFLNLILLKSVKLENVFINSLASKYENVIHTLKSAYQVFTLFGRG